MAKLSKSKRRELMIKSTRVFLTIVLLFAYVFGVAPALINSNSSALALAGIASVPLLGGWLGYLAADDIRFILKTLS